MSLSVCLCVSVCMCVSVCFCRSTSANQQVCQTESRLEMSDFDSALDLLHASQSDALGAPKVCPPLSTHSVITTRSFDGIVYSTIHVCMSLCLSVCLCMSNYAVTLKSRLRVTQGHWKRNRWIDHTRLTISRIIRR